MSATGRVLCRCATGGVNFWLTMRLLFRGPFPSKWLLPSTTSPFKFPLDSPLPGVATLLERRRLAVGAVVTRADWPEAEKGCRDDTDIDANGTGWGDGGSEAEEGGGAIEEGRKIGSFGDKSS